MKLITWHVIIFLISGEVFALNNGLARIPPMGWISSQRFGCNVDCHAYPNDCVSEQLIKSTVDAMLSRGSFAGYKYIIIDDCWMDRNRTSEGKLQGDIRRFPSGIPALAQYVHRKGLKFGLYIDLGNETCGGFPGSFGYYDRDSATLSEWGVDLIKAGGCGLKDIQSCNDGYVTFGRYLNMTGRPMVFACDWPQVLRRLGGQINMTKVMTTCNLYRTFEEMKDNWESLHSLFRYYTNYNPNIYNYSMPGSFNDPDQLVVGDYGLSLDQQRFQMSLWSIMAAPLFVSTDMRTLRRDSEEILLNSLALSINQDQLGKLGIEIQRVGDIHVWRKPIQPHGSFAVALYYTNIQGGPSRVSVRLSDIGLTTAARYDVTEVFSALYYGIMKPWYTLNCEVNPNGTLLFKFVAKD